MPIPFSGFPYRPEVTPLPNVFFGQLVPEITDVFELKASLHLLWLLYHKPGNPRFVTFRELTADGTLMPGMRKDKEDPADTLRHALDLAVERGTFLKVDLANNQSAETVYFINTPADRRAAQSVADGRIVLEGLKVVPAKAQTEKPPNIFVLYEQNIGMLTPMIAEDLKEAEKLYPADWIRDAVKEAVSLNKRNWKYISKILERWQIEGKDGESGRYSKKTEGPNDQPGGYQRLVVH